MMMPGNLRGPHYEVNEDGRQYTHPGYIEMRCQKCGNYFIVAIGAISTCCGNKNCGKETAQ